MFKHVLLAAAVTFASSSLLAAPCADFTDVEDTSPFCPSVTWLKNRNITLGCAATLYCPNDAVTRLQMAAFLNRLADSLFPLTCTAGQVMKWNGAAWICANDDAGAGGGGTVTSVMAGTGLVGSPNPITGAGAINLAPAYQLPQGCTAGQVAKSDGSGAWTCQADANGGGTVTSVATGAGLSGGPITDSGTIALAPTQLLPTTACASGQVPKWNGSSWGCAADVDTNAGGTVSSVTTGVGLTGGPITATGEIGLAATQLLPVAACTNGQVAKWNDTAWICAADLDTNSGGTVTSVTTGTGLTGGPISGSGTIALAAAYQLPQGCGNGEIPKSNGAGGWTCQADAQGSGTVTSVSTGAGLTGGPITSGGTIGLAATQIMPTVACTAGQVPKWSGSAWACAADVDTNSGGTVTSVATGTGLTGGPISASGTIAIATGYQLPQSCAAGEVAKSDGAGAWTCQTDAQGAGTVTSVGTGAGLTGGPITASGSIGLAATQLLPTAACSSGQVAKWNGSAWACGADNDTDSGGTVTSVATGPGLAGGPITGSGTITLAATQLLPTLACSSGQVVKWNGTAWACASDLDTNAGGTVTSVATGTGLTGGPITGSGTIGVDTAYLQRRVSASCAAGSSIRAIAEDGTVTCEADDGGSANAFVQSGNAFGATAVLGTTDDEALEIHVNNARVMRYEPNAISPNVIGGHPANNITAGVRGATIAGGGVPFGSTEPEFNQEGPNRVTDIYGTVSGGYNNRAGNDGGPLTDGAFTTVGGGFGNTAHGFAATVAGGDLSIANGNWAAVGGGINQIASGTASTAAGGAGNVASGGYATVPGGGSGTASGDWSTVGGGSNNTASGNHATVPGGKSNTASGVASLAAGNRAKTQSAGPSPVIHDGAFVWADANDFDFHSGASNEFAARATGGMRLVLAVDGAGAPTWSCAVADGGSWACSSDRNLKQNLRKLDGQAVLAQLRAMPIYAWNPKGRNAHVRHVGPTAQDFHAAFALGDSPLRIGQQDADGVALAAIKGVDEKLDAREAALRREVEAKSAEILDLRRQVAELRMAQQSEVAELRHAIDVLMARTAGDGRVARMR